MSLVCRIYPLRCRTARTHSSLIQMGYETDINSYDKLMEIMRRLPVHLQSKWADTAGQLTLRGTEPTFSHLAKFVEERAMLANTMYGEFVGSSPEKERRVKQQSKEKTADHRSKGKSFATQIGTRDGSHPNVSSPVSSCPLCSGQHWLAKGERMEALTPGERKSFVRQAGLCDNCFGRSHMAINCRSKMKCQVNGCGWKHHTMLHLQKKNNDGNTPSNIASATPDANSASIDIVSGAGDSGRCSALESGKKNVCLRIVSVVVKRQGQTGEIVTNALLDPGSDVSLCDAGLLEKLGVFGRSKEFTLTTVNGASDSQNGFEVSLVARGINLHEEITLSRVWAVDPLRLPQGGAPTKEGTDKWSHLKGINFPRIQSDEVSLLMGCDVPEAHWVYDRRRGRRGRPYAVCTSLGWNLMGPLNSCTSNCFSVNFVCYDDAMPHQQMERMLRNDFNEPMVASKTAISVEDHRALAQMEGSVKIVNGHYRLGLPWRKKSVRLPNNRAFAMTRLNHLKKRFQRDPHLFEKYKETIDCYVSSGYARQATHEDFDCTVKFKGSLLNDQLLQGPDMTNGLVGVLIRFRQELVAVVADIEGMFHQVRVAPEDCHALRFLWWPNSRLTEEPVDHQMLAPLFGATSPPSCASFSLKRTALDNQGELDTETIETVSRNFYVDDCLKSVATTEEAVRLSSQLRELLSRGGFRLTKWISNDRNLIASVPMTERAPSVINLDLDDLPTERTLGVQWDMETDSFSFRFLDQEKAPTCRGILLARCMTPWGSWRQ